MINFTDLFECEGKYRQPEKKINKYEVPWVDKYRPKKLTDIVYQNDIIVMLKTILETGNMPHLLFYGPPGTGKTSSILAVAMELFGPNKYKDRVTELNASDERGINIVRNKIVTLARSAVGGRDPGYLCPPYKIIILDEADAMTIEAQSALRKTMEDNSKVTRFCFICNYINQIIDPITSRCVKFRFKPIAVVEMVNKLTSIVLKEKVRISEGAIETIAKLSNGDMRRGIILLQNLNYLGEYIESEHVYSMANMVPICKINEIISVCFDEKNISCGKIQMVVNKLNMDGYPISNVLNQLVLSMVNDSNISDKVKASVCVHVARTEKRLIDGSDEYLQLVSVLMNIKKIVMGI